MIEVNEVSRLFGSFKAVDNISFSIQKGEIVGLLGPNGAGKTTTMRMITGFLEPTQGTILVDGLNVIEHPVETKRRIGYMPESAPLYQDMIVADYMEYIASVEGVPSKEKVPLLAETCGLKEVMHKNISELSRGNRQRVGLAHALMGDPEILILDEPTSGLDPNQVGEVRSLIKKIGETRTVIISTHILSEVEMLCNRVIIISGGRKVADGPTEELKGRYQGSESIELLIGGAELSSIKSVFTSLPGIKTCTAEPYKAPQGEPLIKVLLGVEGGNECRPQVARHVLTHNWDLYSMDLKKNSLEDVFRSLTKGEQNDL